MCMGAICLAREYAQASYGRDFEGGRFISPMAEEDDTPAVTTQDASAETRGADESCVDADSGAETVADTAAAAATPPKPAPDADAPSTDDATPADKSPSSEPDATAATSKDDDAAGDAKRPGKRSSAAKPDARERTEPSLAMPPSSKRAAKIVSGAQAPAKGDAPKTSAMAKVATMFGNLDADQRIRKAAEQNERLLWAGAAGATLIYVLLIASQSMMAMLVPVDQLQQQQQKERRGQGGNVMSVEIVPEPDKNSKTRKWRDGNEVPAQQQMPPMPAMPQTAALPEPQQEIEKEAEKQAEQKSETEAEKERDDKQAEQKHDDVPRPEEEPMLLDLERLVDAAASDLKQQIDRHYDRSQQRRQRQASTGAVKVRGSGASGKSDPFTDSVIAALMKTRPGPVALWGRVLVSFQIGENGQLRYVKVLQSSGNTAMDDAAVSAIRRARFKRPPPGMTADQRTYIIDYVFG